MKPATNRFTGVSNTSWGVPTCSILPQQDDFRAHLVPQLGVQVAQRFVHQEHLGVPDHGAADGHALALAAGQGAGFPGQVFGDAQNLRRVGDAFVDLILGHLLQPQAESDVVVYRHMRIQGVVLENHGDIPVLGLQVIDDLTIDFQRAFGDVLQAGDHPQSGGLAAAGRSDKDHKFLVFDFQVEVMDCRDFIVIDLFDIDQFYTCHTITAPSEFLMLEAF